MSRGSLNPEFDSFAEDYDGALNQGLSVSGEDKNFFARGRIRWTARCAARLGLAVRSIHDFGCGTGSGTPFFYESFPELKNLVGTDVSAKSLDVATRVHGGRGVFKVMEESRPDGSADLVYCNGVFHHIPLDQRQGAMKYIFDCLRPGGLLALWENNPWNPGTRLVMSRIPFDKDAIMLWPRGARRLARSVGFEVVKTNFLFIFPRMLKWFRPLERLATRLPLGTQYMVMCRKA